MTVQQINVAKDFTRFPAGRFVSDGRFSGERFRREILEPGLTAGNRLIIYLDGVMGYGSSFLEEAFGGLVRAGFAPDILKSQLSIVSDDPSLSFEIESYMAGAHH